MNHSLIQCPQDKCFGCMACLSICVNKAIKIKLDEQGFWLTETDPEKCVSCGLCNKVCPALQEPIYSNFQQLYFAFKNQDEIRMQSSSGGFFSALAEKIIEEKGHVYGVVFDQDYSVKHVCASDQATLAQMRKSKYVQSETGTIYQLVKKDLQNGIRVLFTGTPCQIDGLYHYLGKRYDNLITLDVICIGVGSPIIFADFLQYIRKRIHGKIDSFDFRSKGKYKGVVVQSGSKFYAGTLWLRSYNYLNAHGYIKRASCFDCRYRSFRRVADLTMGDYWSCKQHHADFYDKKGCSVVMINSQLGEKVMEKYIFHNQAYCIRNLQKQEVSQNSLVEKKMDLKIKQVFNSYYRKHGYAQVIRKYGDTNLVGFLKSIMRKLINTR